MSCCVNDLGSFPHNRVIDTGLDAESAGLHELRFQGANFVKFSKFLNLGTGNDITIPVGTLNEDFVYNFEVIKPDGSKVSVDDCTTFSLQTFINKIACDDVDYL